MKKLLSLVLICVMGFGMISCVESEESQSVTELRNAKAEQLKALVNLYNAQAEAARITAQAEAALKAAQAAYQQAQADYTAEQLDQLKKKFELQLESLIAEYESKIAKCNYEKALYEKQLMDKLAEIEAAEKAKIKALYTEYSNNVTALNNANSNLIGAKVNLAKVEAEIVDVKEAAQTRIAEQKEIIALGEEIIVNAEARIAELEDHMYSDLDLDSLLTRYNELYDAIQMAELAYTGNEAKAEENTRKAAENAVNEMVGMIDEFNFVFNGQYVIANNVNSDDPNWWPMNNNSYLYPYLSFSVKESALDAWKNYVTNTELDDAVATATENLEKAEAVLKTFQGFKADFEKAEAARAALYAYDQAYANYDEDSETIENAQLRVDYIPDQIELWEGLLEISTAQLDTLNKVDLTKFTTEDYDEWNFAFWRRPSSDMVNSMNAFRAALATQEEKLDALEAAQKDLENVKKALEAAEKALAALTEEATEAEVEAAENAVKAAQNDVKANTEAVETAEKAVKAAQEAVKAAYDKVVYQAEVQCEDDKDEVNRFKESLKSWEEKLAKAKENKAALEAAYAPAKAALATLTEMFGADSDFKKFWDENSFHNPVYDKNNSYLGNAVPTKFRKVNFIADKNNDDKPDMNLNSDGTPVNGLYLVSAVKNYDDMAPATNWYYFTEDEAYVGPDFDKMVAHYTTKVAEAKDALTEANNNLANANEWKTNWDAKEKELRDCVAALNEQIPDVQALVDAYYVAVEAADAAEKKIAELKGEADAIKDLMKLALGYEEYGDDNESIFSMILACEDAIIGAESAIAEAEAEIKEIEKVLASIYSGANLAWTPWNDSNETLALKEGLVAKYKAEIEKYTVEVELYTKLVEDAKAALDAALSASDAE